VWNTFLIVNVKRHFKQKCIAEFRISVVFVVAAVPQ